MVKSGIVKNVCHATQTGTIECLKTKSEYFFSAIECVGYELPPQFSVVTFVRDPDYKSTFVAEKIMRVGRKSA